MWGDSFSTVGDNFSTVEGIQYIGGITPVHAGGYLQYSGGTSSVQWEDNINTVEVAQYSGGKDLKYYEFSKKTRNLFQSLFRFEIRSTTSQASYVDHG